MMIIEVDGWMDGWGFVCRIIYAQIFPYKETGMCFYQGNIHQTQMDQRPVIAWWYYNVPS